MYELWQMDSFIGAWHDLKLEKLPISILYDIMAGYQIRIKCDILCIATIYGRFQ